MLYNWASTRETCFRRFANNKSADQPAHPHSLTRAFVIRFSESIISQNAISEISILWLVSVAEDTDLNIALSETPKTGTASIGSVDSLYPSVFIYCLNLHQFLILCSSKAMMFVKLYFRTSDIYLISLVSLDPSGFHLRTK